MTILLTSGSGILGLRTWLQLNGTVAGRDGSSLSLGLGERFAYTVRMRDSDRDLRWLLLESRWKLGFGHW